MWPVVLSTLHQAALEKKTHFYSTQLLYKMRQICVYRNFMWAEIAQFRSTTKGCVGVDQTKLPRIISISIKEKLIKISVTG
jgi:hypothetical protein